MTGRWQKLPSRLADERGFALVVALAVLMITLLLGAVAISVAVDTNSSGNRDTNATTAVQAADAGARTAVYRLNVFLPSQNNCPTPTATAVGSGGAPSATICAPQTGTLGNGATFTYWVSRAMQTGDACTGSWVTSGLGSVEQRCITAIGAVNGVSARVQERVAAYNSTPVFPTAIFGTKSVTVQNNVTIISDTPGTPALMGTNGVLNAAPTGGGTTVIDGYALPPGATVNLGGNVTNNGPTTGPSTPYPVPTPAGTSTSQNTASGGTCVGASPQTNCDYRIGNCPSLACDPTTGNVYFDPVGRTLYLDNNSSLVLGGGFYNFCSLYMGNNAVITIAPLTEAAIYIDSPADPTSGTSGSSTNPPCSTSASAHGVAPGTFSMSQGSTFNYGFSALKAQIYVYGDPNDTPPNNTVSLQNTASISFGLVAPFSNVILSPSNNSLFRGAIVGYTVTLGNASHFTYEADTSTLQKGSLEQFFRSYWEQCPAAPSTPTDPTSGC
jgi:Tfp pilus assembly protein PilX